MLTLGSRPMAQILGIGGSCLVFKVAHVGVLFVGFEKFVNHEIEALNRDACGIRTTCQPSCTTSVSLPGCETCCLNVSSDS